MSEWDQFQRAGDSSAASGFEQFPRVSNGSASSGFEQFAPVSAPSPSPAPDKGFEQFAQAPAFKDAQFPNAGRTPSAPIPDWRPAYQAILAKHPNLPRDQQRQLLQSMQDQAEGPNRYEQTLIGPGETTTVAQQTPTSQFSPRGMVHAFRQGVGSSVAKGISLVAPEYGAQAQAGMNLVVPAAPGVVTDVIKGTGEMAGDIGVAGAVGAATGGTGFLPTLTALSGAKGVGEGRMIAAERRANGEDVSGAQEFGLAAGHGVLNAGAAYAGGKIAGEVIPGAVGKIVSPAIRYPVAVGADVAANAVLGAAQQVGSNAVAQAAQVNDAPSLMEGVPEAAAAGAGQGIAFAPVTIHGVHANASAVENARHVQAIAEHVGASETAPIDPSQIKIVDPPAGRPGAAVKYLTRNAGRPVVFFKAGEASDRVNGFAVPDGPVYVNADHPADALPAIVAHEVLGHTDQRDVLETLHAFRESFPNAQKAGERTYAADAEGSPHAPSPDALPEEGTARIIEEIYRNPGMQDQLARQNPGLLMRLADGTRRALDALTGGNRAKQRVIESQLKLLDPLFEQADAIREQFDRQQIKREESALDQKEAQQPVQQPAPAPQPEAAPPQPNPRDLAKDQRLVDEENQIVDQRLAEQDRRRRQEELYRQEAQPLREQMEDEQDTARARANADAAELAKRGERIGGTPHNVADPVDNSRQLGLYAKDASGNAQEIGEPAIPLPEPPPPAPENKAPEPPQLVAPASELAGESGQGMPVAGNRPGLPRRGSTKSTVPPPAEEVKGKTHTTIPREWQGRQLYNWGGTGIALKKGERAKGESGRQGRRFGQSYIDQLEPINKDAKTLIDAVHSRSKEVWDVKGKGGGYTLAPKLVVRDAMAELSAKGYDMDGEIGKASQLRQERKAKWAQNAQDRERKIGGVGDKLVSQFVMDSGKYERGGALNPADPKNQGTIKEALEWSQNQPKDSDGYLLGYIYSKAKSDPRGTKYEWVQPGTLMDGTEITVGKEKLMVEHDPDTGRVMLHDGVTMDVTDSHVQIPAKSVKQFEPELPEGDFADFWDFEQDVKPAKAEEPQEVAEQAGAVRGPPVKENPPASGQAKPKFSIRPADEAGIPDDKKDSKSYLESARKQWLEKGTDSPFFKRWFGDSKVVDDQGKPLVVYHGTNGESFNQFSPNRAMTDFDGSFWFTGDEKTAGFHAGNGEGSQTMPVYVSLKNPLVTREQPGIVEREREVIRDAKNRGHDGIIFREATGDYQDIYVAFDPAQIKSATANRGTFDAKNPDIRYSINPLKRPAPTQGKRFELPNESKADALRRKTEDEFLPVRRATEAIRKQGGVVTDESDAGLRQDLFPGRTAERIRQVEDDYVKPIRDAMTESGLTQDKIDDYLTALHAPERNDTIAQRDPSMTDGSGMSTAVARRIVAQADAGPHAAAYKKIAGLVHQMNRDTLQSQHDAGLISDDTYNELAGRWKHYVPLRTDMEGDGFNLRPGQGFNIRGKEFQAATGRSSRADSPLAFSIMQAQEKAVRAEKNRVGQSLLKLVQDNPDPDLWTINDQPTVRKPGKNGRVVERPDPLFQNADNVVSVKEGGKTHLIEFKGEAGRHLARAVKRLGTHDGGKLIGILQKPMGVYRNLQTNLNPEFIVPNLIRDMQTAGINLSADQGKGMAVRAIKGIPAAARAAFDVIGNHEANPGSAAHDYMREYLKHGGKVDSYALDDFAATQKKLASLLKDANPTSARRLLLAAKWTGRAIDRVNGAVETGTRLSAYIEARKSGMTADRAAQLAKNLTVNFNRKGELGTTFNTLYMFSNASIQGNVRMIRALAGTPRGRRIAAGIFASGLAYRLMLPGLLGKDKEGRDIYDTLPEWEKNNNLLIPTGGGKYVKIPLPYGYNVLFNAGGLAGDAMNGRTTPGSAAVNLVGNAAEAFSPLGKQGSFAQTVSPTLLQPFVQASENTDWTGRKIAPEQEPYSPPVPNSRLAWRTTSPYAKAVAQWLNSVTGGDEIKPGKIDVSPAMMDHFVGWATGGLGRFIKRSAELPERIKEGNVEANQVPVARRFVGQESSHVNQTEFYDTSKRIAAAEAAVKHYRESGQEEKAAAEEKKEGESIDFSEWSRSAARRIGKLRSARDAAEEKGDAKAAKAAENEMQAEFSRFNAAYRAGDLPERWKIHNEFKSLDARARAVHKADRLVEEGSRDEGVKLYRANKLSPAEERRYQVLKDAESAIREIERRRDAGRVTAEQADRAIARALKGI